MSTATMEQDRLVQTPEDQVLFMCRRSDLRLVRKSIQPIYGPGGRVTGQEPGETVAFRDGVLRVPKTGKVRLEDGREADAREIVQWLEGHRFFNDRQDGFWRVDPSAPGISQPEMATLLEIIRTHDEERLVEFIAQERAGWGREDLLEAAEKELVALRKTLADMAAAEGAPGA